ncbi:MAG: hypothetical protein Q9216_006081 [Gyalolechia sp. 2 TL-2023]
MFAYNKIQTSSVAHQHGLPRESLPTSPVELDSSSIGCTHKFDSQTLVWLTSFPHTVNGLLSSSTPLVLASRSFSDLRNAQRKLRQPGKDPDFDEKYGIPLQCARAKILVQNQKCLEQKGKCWSSCKLKGPPIRRVTNKAEARKLDDESSQRIADAFAHLSMTSFPPSLAQDMQFNVFYKPCDPLRSDSSMSSSCSLSSHDSEEHAEFPLVFRALVPSNGWRGISPNPADEHNVHVLELTESVRYDLTRFWFKTWDLEEWPEEEDFYGGVLKRTKSWSSRFEVDDDDVRAAETIRADMETTLGSDRRRVRGGRCGGELICRTFRRLEWLMFRGFTSRKGVKDGTLERFVVD